MATNTIFQIKRQIYSWIICSFFSVGSLLIIIFNHDPSLDNDLLLQIFSIIIILSITWWFWIMRSMHRLITSRSEEIEMIHDINIQVSEVRQEIELFLKNKML